MTVPAWWNHLTQTLNGQLATDPNFFGGAFGVETRQDGPLMGTVGPQWSMHSICEIGSMTKVFTATATLLALEESGRFTADSLVRDLPGMEFWRSLPSTDPRGQIQVKHLLDHSSGLPYFKPVGMGQPLPCDNGVGAAGPSVDWAGSPGLTNECIRVGTKWFRAREVDLDNTSAYVIQTYKPPQGYPIGQKVSYCNFDYVIAGRIVEKLTERPLNVYLKQKLFAPLGMTDSFFFASGTGDAAFDALVNESVTQQQRDRIPDVKLITPLDKNGMRAFPPEVAQGPHGGWDKLRKGWRLVWPEGGMYSTVADLMIYLRLLRDKGLYQGRQVLSQNIVNSLVTEQVSTDGSHLGRTMGFKYTGGLLDVLGRFMTYFWLDLRPDPAHPDNPVLGVFLTQRLTNVIVNDNTADGTKVKDLFFSEVYNNVSGMTGVPVSGALTE
jgi:CubicO group peptidase (beta-lactamase class C family)